MRVTVQLGLGREHRQRSRFALQGLLAPLGIVAEEARDEDALLTFGSSANVASVARLHIPFDSAAWRDSGRALQQLRLAVEAGPLRTQGEGFRFAGDVLALTFHCLARPEETQEDGYDAWGRFRFNATFYHQLGLGVGRPVLQPVIDLLAQALQHLGVPVERPIYPRGRRFAVALTHDVDSLRKWTWRRVMREILESAEGIVRNRPDVGMHRLGAASRDYVRSRSRGVADPHWSFPQLLQIDAAAAGSTFFLKTAFRHPLDGRNRRDYLAQLPRLIAELTRPGTEISLHGSTLASEQPEVLAQERGRLEDLLQRDVHGVRFHNLRFRIDRTPRVLAGIGVTYDSTLGFPEMPGFRSGLAHPHLLYDLTADQAVSVIEIPLVLMDTTLIARRYRGLPLEEARHELLSVLEEVRRARGSVSLLWHNDLVDSHSSRGLGVLYEEAVRWILDHGGWATTAQDLADWWRDRLLPAPESRLRTRVSVGQSPHA